MIRGLCSRRGPWRRVERPGCRGRRVGMRLEELCAGVRDESLAGVEKGWG